MKTVWLVGGFVLGVFLGIGWGVYQSYVPAHAPPVGIVWKVAFNDECEAFGGCPEPRSIASPAGVVKVPSPPVLPHNPILGGIHLGCCNPVPAPRCHIDPATGLLECTPG